MSVPEPQDWQEIDSQVHLPGLWLSFLVGSVFLLFGILTILVVASHPQPGIPAWVWWLLGTFIVMGAMVLTIAVSGVVRPASIRHARCDSLPNVPLEPVIVEGAVVHGRVTHEVIEDVEGWRFEPARRLWRDDKRFLFGFGIPFLALFATILTWVFHDRFNLVWPAAILCGTFGTVVSGGSAFLLVGMILRAGYRRLCSVSIPRSGGPLEVDAPIEPDTPEVDLTNGLKWMFLGDVERHRLVIPRELLKAVQLCPWRFVVKGGAGKTSTWAVQGLLVLASAEQGDYHRLPILLTSDFIGAARLMQLLASTLHVPYLFCADAEGWQVEELRARKRPPLRAGGIHT